MITMFFTSTKKSLAILICTFLLLVGCGGGGGSDTPPAETPAPPPAAPPAETPPPAAPTTYSVSGTITAAIGSYMDSDVNDPNAPYTANDTTDQAQAITSPAMVGGYAGAVGSGVYGDRFAANADPDDYYQCTLSKDQVITLHVSDFDSTNPSAKDLDLYLYTTTPTTFVASSTNYLAQETITVPANGSYYIRVHAVSGSSNYILTIGQPPTTTGAPAMGLEQDFVPGEVVVRFKDAALPTAVRSDTAAMQVRAEAVGLLALAGGEGRSLLMTLGDTTQQQKAFSVLGITAKKDLAAEIVKKDATLARKYDTIRLVKALRARADVAAADLNYIYQAYKTPNDQYYASQWHYPLINLPQAWDITTGSSSVRVAVVDTGVLMHHPDLINKVTNTGYDFISSVSVANDGDGIDSNPDDPGDGSTPGNSSFHGTHVAGTIAAQTNNTTGVAGIAWDAKIIPLRVLGKGGGTSYDTQQALRYAAGLSNDSHIILSANDRAHIINLSLGGGGYSQQDQDTYTAVRNQGIIIIAAAGNENLSTPSYPASYSGVVSVSAVDMNKAKAYYSNYGPSVDVAAPGGDGSVDKNGDGYADGVLSTAGDDSSGSIQYVYKFYQGTSMASPHMAGVVALMKAVYIGLTPDQLDSAIQQGEITMDIGINGPDGPTVRNDYYGYGLIDALKAVQKAQALAGGIVPATLKIDPGTLNFDANTTSLDLTTSNGGAGTLSITGVTDSATWLTVAEKTVDGLSKLGTYTATVDRTNLESGTYNATITFTTNVGTTNVPVTVQKGATGSGTNAGYHYIILIDPATGATASTVAASNNNGSYSYSFTGVAAGTYRLIAGTDSDNDGYICDAGEACGGYPTVNALDPVTVGTSNLSGLDFSTGFNYGIRTTAAYSAGQPVQGFRRFSGKRME